MQARPQLDVDAASEKASAERKDEIARCKAAIEQLGALKMGPEHSSSIWATLDQLQHREAAYLAKQKDGMIKAADDFKQALCKLLQPKHSFLLSKFQ